MCCSALEGHCSRGWQSTSWGQPDHERTEETFAVFRYSRGSLPSSRDRMIEENGISNGRPVGLATETRLLRDYLSILWRRKWIILFVVVLTTAAAYAASARQAKVYEASADLIYEKQLDVSSSLTGQSYTDANERTVQLLAVGSILASPVMRQRTAGSLASQDYPATGFDIESEVVSGDAPGATASLSSVVRITATSHSPEVAAAAANAYAQGFVDYRRDTVKRQIQRGIDVVKTKMDTFPEGARRSTEYLTLQQRMQDLQLLRDTATGNFSVLVPAEVPEAPAAPKPVQSAFLGFGVGLIVAVGLAVLLEQFDTRVRRPDEVAGILRLPILGRVPRIHRRLREEGSVVTFAHPEGQVAEAFRMIRTNLEFMAVDDEVRSFMVTSCVQGEGKSVTVANLAVAMAMAGKKVVVVDGDLRRPMQHIYFGIPNGKGVSTVATGQHALKDCMVPVLVFDPGVSGRLSEPSPGLDAQSRLYVLPSGPLPPNPGEIVSSGRLTGIIDHLAQQADVVIVDTPAMLPVGDASAVASKVNGLIFLADLDVVKRPQLTAVAEQLARLPVKMLGVVVRVSHLHGKYYGAYRYGYSSTSGRRARDPRMSPEEPVAQAPGDLADAGGSQHEGVVTATPLTAAKE